MKKYEILYSRIRDRIGGGVLSEGERLPSLREEADRSCLSVNTVLKAYQLLTDDGFIGPRERGGYYVRTGRPFDSRGGWDTAGPTPQVCLARAAETGERLDQLYERLLHIDSSFACAAPDLDILPVGDLKRIGNGLDCSWMEYGYVEGDLPLRRRIARDREDWDGPADPGDIVITNGATEALSLILHSFLEPGDRVILESPTYMNYFRQLAPFNVEICEIPVGGEGIDLALLEGALKEGPVRMMILQPNVQNPTGITMPEEAKSALIGLAERYGVLIVQDDVYGDLYFGAVRPVNLTALSDYEGILLINSYSKSLSPGLRIGWILARGHAGRLAEEKLRLSMDPPRYSQALLAEYVGSRAHRRHLKRIGRVLETRLEEHRARLAEILPRGSSLSWPSGGCLLWIRFPRGIDGVRVFEGAAGKGLIAAPGSLFTSGSQFDNCLRLNGGMKLTEERSRTLAHIGEACSLLS